MAHEPQLEHLTALLGQCLGRIDERAYRLQQLGDDEADLDAQDVLECETATLHELVDTLLDRCDAPPQFDVNRIVDQAVTGCMSELAVPILVRERLAPGLPPAGCSASQLASAVQRALVISATRLDAGGELIVGTRAEGGAVVIEIESRGGRRDRHLQQRALTLCEFVASFGGNCHIDLDDRDNLLVVVELPQPVAHDEG